MNLYAHAIAVTSLWTAGFCLVGCETTPFFEEEYDRFQQIEIGMNESEVRAKLGEPVHVYESQSAPERYYVDGYAYRERPITNKVLIYVATEPIAYIYTDSEDNVEEVFIGGS